MTDQPTISASVKAEAQEIVGDATPPFSVLEAIAMIVDDYDDKWVPGAKRMDLDGIQITVANHVALIRGTDDGRDWWRNLAVLPTFILGDRGNWWVHGALINARSSYGFIKGLILGGYRIDLIVGHSAGGPSAQIAGYSLGLPVWTFASPRALYFGQPKLTKPITNYMNPRDPIRYVYPFARHVGETKWLDVESGWPSARYHRAARYMQELSP